MRVESRYTIEVYTDIGQCVAFGLFMPFSWV